MTSIGPYKILEEIGRGGMATVFRAYQASTERFVALKVIHQNIQGEDTAMRRFQREAHLIAQLEHHHIVPIHDFDGSHVPPYIVMRYMKHGTLDQILALGRLPMERSIQMLKQVISAVDYAHRCGIVHRDLKPSNILMDGDGNAFVTDFGIARLTDQYNGEHKTSITESGFAVGTPDYMSPEQARGEREVDQRADVYALGGLLFHLVTGKKPYEGSNAVEVIIKHVNYPVPSILTIDPKLSPELDVIIRKAMSKDVRDRFQTAAAFGLALERLLHSNHDSNITQPEMPPPQETHYSTLSQATQESFAMRLDDDSHPSNPIRITEHKRVVKVVCINALEYADLVGSQGGNTEQALAELWEAVGSVVEEMGGTVILRESAMLLAMWSVQVAHRTDTEYAVRASIWVQKALSDVGAKYLGTLKSNYIPLSIGVSIGGVLSRYDSNRNLQFDLGSSTVNTAIWLAQASTGSILVSHEIFVATRQYFEFEAGPPVQVNGRKSSTLSYRVREEKLNRNTVPHETQEIHTQEVNSLVQSYRQVLQSHKPMVISVQTGKTTQRSRLLDEFFSWLNLQSDQPYFFRGASIPAEKRQYPYTVLRSMFQMALQIADHERESRMQYQLEQGIANLIPVQNRAIAHFIGYLMGFQFADSPHLNRFSQTPDQLEQLAQESCLRFFIELAQQKAIIILIEDMQWADPKSVNLLNRLVVENASLPILVICRTTEDQNPTSSTLTHPTDPIDDSTMNLFNRH